MMPHSCASRRDADKDSCKSASCPHCLPPELLSRIFEFSVENDLNPYGFPVPARSTAPLILTWICSSWRRLAISFSSLWTSVSLGSHGSAPSSDDHILDVFISRSGDTLPLSFALNYDQPGSSHPRKLSLDKSQSQSYLSSIRIIARRLVIVRHRWRHLTVNALILVALEPFLRQLSLGTPMLEYLSVSTKYTGFHGAEHRLDLTSCHQLRTARILSPLVFFDPSLPRLEQLTTLELHFCHSQLDTLAWLSSCPNLEKLSIELYASNQIEPSSAQQIRLSQLSHLSLACFYGESDPGPLLGALTVPSLYSLGLSRCGLSLSGPDHSWQNVKNLLRRSEDPPLHELRLVDTPANSDELSQVLQRASGVKRLVLGGAAVTDDLLRRMYERSTFEWRGNASLLSPRLESLELLDVAASFPSITALASSRARTPESQTVDYDTFKTLKRLTLSNEKFSQHFQHLSICSPFPPGLNVVLK